MKRFWMRALAALLCLTCLMALVPGAALAAGTVRVYCQAPDDWSHCKVYWWGSDSPSEDWPGNAMVTDRDGTWYIDVPTDAQGLIFTNGEGEKSGDLSVPTDDKVMFVYENHYWTTYGRVDIQELYIVAGSGSLCGSDWNPSDMNNRMFDDDADGVYTKTYLNVPSGTYEVKVTVGSWSQSWGDPEKGANYAFTVREDGTTVTVGFDTVTQKVLVGLNEDIQPPLPGVSLSGTVVSFGAASDAVTLTLGDQSLRRTGNRADYAFTNLQPGSYTLTVSKSGHVTRSLELTLEENLVQDVTICPVGDVTGEGNVNIMDVATVYAHTRGTRTQEGYALSCADLSGDGKVNILDTALLYNTVRGTDNPKPPVDPEPPVDPKPPVDGGHYVVGEDELPYTDEEIYAQLFDPANKIEVELDMPDKELQKLQDDYEHYRSFGSKSPIYRMGTLTITITTADSAVSYQINEVGARMKGNTSRTSFYNKDEGIYNYIHFKFDFQETFDDEEYYGEDCKVWETDELRKERKDRLFAGMEKLEMRWNKCYDRTYLKESYCYEVYRSEGVLAPNCNIGVLTWSGARMGIYTVQEPVDDIFIERNLPEETWGGDLYKCGWTSEGASFTNTNSIGVEDEDKCAFYVYDLKTNKKKSTHTQLINLINHMNSGSVTKESFAQLVDVDNFLRFAAVSYFMGNPDDLRNNYNNFYIYFCKDTGKVLFIPYDYDRCLGVNREYNPSGHSMTRDNPFGEGDQRNPIYRYSIDNGGFYTAEFTQVLLEVAENERLKPETFAARYELAKSHYAGQVTPERNLRNADGRKFAFDIDHTASASSGDNMSFKDYMEAKMSTFRGYMGQSDPSYAECYIRGDFNGWSVDSAYRLSKSGDLHRITLTMGNSFSFKVFNQQDQTWMGAECLSADTTVSYDTDGHSNIVLRSGTYQVTYDPANRLITITGGGTWTVQG